METAGEGKQNNVRVGCERAICSTNGRLGPITRNFPLFSFFFGAPIELIATVDRLIGVNCLQPAGKAHGIDRCNETSVTLNVD